MSAGARPSTARKAPRPVEPPFDPATTEPTEWPDDAVCDRFVGDWPLWQRRRGHRTSTDDMLVAWTAVRRSPRPVQRYCDLGCGIGSVLLLTAHALRPTASLGIEAQAQSALLLGRTLSELPDPPPIALLNADFRTAVATVSERFELITGSPPYFPWGTGVPSDDAQRRACRFELRGGIEAYLEAAEALLAPAGEVHVVFQTQWADRVDAAAERAGLRLVERVDLYPRTDRPEPFLSTWSYQRAADGQGGSTPGRLHLATRDARGQETPEWQALRRALALV